MPRMSDIVGNQQALTESIARMCDAATRPHELELNCGPRNRQALNDHLARQPLETIDREGLVIAAKQAFVTAMSR